MMIIKYNKSSLRKMKKAMFLKSMMKQRLTVSME